MAFNFGELSVYRAGTIEIDVENKFTFTLEAKNFISMQRMREMKKPQKPYLECHLRYFNFVVVKEIGVIMKRFMTKLHLTKRFS